MSSILDLFFIEMKNKSYSSICGKLNLNTKQKPVAGPDFPGGGANP